MREKEKAVSFIREFNRFYMPVMDLLGNHYLGTEYSVTEARVLFELYAHEGCNAASIVKSLNIDKSYLSRIIKQYEERGFLTRARAKEDTRSLKLHLTEEGEEQTKRLIEKSDRQIGDLLEGLQPEEWEKITEALGTAAALLKKAEENVKDRRNQNP